MMFLLNLLSVQFCYIFCIIYVLSRNQSPIRCRIDDVTIAHMSTTTACAVSRALVSLFCSSSMVYWSYRGGGDGSGAGGGDVAMMCWPYSYCGVLSGQ